VGGALGLRAGAAALPDLRGAVAAAPVPGLRAHLAIVLAGLGERALVETLALHDPDSLVRATAGEHLVRTSPPAPAFASDLTIARLLQDPDGDVRYAVLREWLRRATARQLPPVPTDELGRLARDPDLPVRRLAVEVLASLPLTPAITGVFTQQLAVEPNADLRGWLASRLIATGHARAALGLVRGDASDRDEDILRALVEHGQRFTWPEIARLADRGQPALDTHLLALVNDAEQAALPWLLACATRPASWPPAKTREDGALIRQVWSAGKAAESLLDRLLPSLHPSQLSQHDRELTAILYVIADQRLSEAEQYVLDEYQDPEDPDVQPAMEELHASDWYQADARRIQHIRRLLLDDER
jgi:hypothetical protein